MQNVYGGIAQTVFDFTTGEDANVGFKDYDELIFNNKQNSDNLSPFTSELWNKTMNWYKVFAIISGTLILIAFFINTATGGTFVIKENVLSLYTVITTGIINPA